MALITALKERDKKLQILREDALREAKRLAAHLREHYEFESLFLHGSILTDRFRFHSDIDLIIKGMKVEEFFKAYALLLRESKYRIDLRPFEELKEDFQERLLTNGIKIG